MDFVVLLFDNGVHKFYTLSIIHCIRLMKSIVIQQVHLIQSRRSLYSNDRKTSEGKYMNIIQFP
jgi:hypothetical protein